MLKHHEDSIKLMTEYYRNDPEIKALFLIGSVVTGTERPDSDLDGVAVISPEYCQRKREGAGTMETVLGKCTYEGGYFDIHFHTVAELEEMRANGSEPMRNMLMCARPLFCDIPGLTETVAHIPDYPKEDAAARQFRFYCTLKMYHTYFWEGCKPEGHMRFHVADGMIYNLYRLILIENEILFPSVRKLEFSVSRASNKPERIIEKCESFMKTLSDEDAAAIVEAYEKWTKYDYPKDHGVIMNNFSNPWEWN